MTDRHEKLLNLDNDKLIDVVKNYRQYGYDEELRELAIGILADRGISREELQITGSFENRTFDIANDLFASFLNYSKIAFVMYLVLLASKLTAPLLTEGSIGLAAAVLITSYLSLILYIVYLIKSFIKQNQFYKAIGKDYGMEGAILYLFLGLPFYFLMFFFYRNQMKEQMKSIK